MRKNRALNAVSREQHAGNLRSHSCADARLPQTERRIRQSEKLRVPDPDEDVGDEAEEEGNDDAVGDGDAGGFRFSDWIAYNVGTENAFFEAAIGGVIISVSLRSNTINVHSGGATYTYPIQEPLGNSVDSRKAPSNAFSIPFSEVFSKAVALAALTLREQTSRLEEDAKRLSL